MITPQLISQGYKLILEVFRLTVLLQKINDFAWNMAIIAAEQAQYHSLFISEQMCFQQIFLSLAKNLITW